MDPVTIGLGLLGLLALSGPRSGGPIKDLPEGSEGSQAVFDAAEAAGVNTNWGRFLATVACHESGWKTNVALGVASKLGRPDVKVHEKRLGELESAAATQAYRRHAEDYGLWEDCPFPEEAYGFGSGGWYGLLPVFGLWPFRKSPELVCALDPRIVIFQAIPSTIMAIAFAQRSMQRKTFKANPTWGNLNRSWKSPALMDGLPADTVMRVDAKFAKCLKSLGLPASFADQKVDKLPTGWSAIETYRRLEGANA